MISLFSFIIVNQFRDPTLKTELSDDSEEISIVENVDILGGETVTLKLKSLK